MMYVELMKNFLLADSSELMALRLISVCWAWWLLDSFRPAWFLLSRHDVRRFDEKFFFSRFEQADGCQTHFGLLSPKTFDCYFLDMMYVEFMKNFPLADSSELMGVRPISASWAQNVWFLLSGHDVRGVHEKIFSCRFELADGCQTHFGLLSPKTFDSYFLDMMYVEFMNNFSLADSSELMAARLISASWARKRFDSYFLDMMYVEFMKNFPLPIRTCYCLFDSFRPPERKNVWFLLSRHDVRRVHEKFSSGRFELANGCLTHFGLLSTKTFDSYFLDMMYVKFMKNFPVADSN